MPKEAVKTGGVDKTVSLFDLTDSIVRMIQDMRG
jgi:chemotaxis response regulator CheB